jgi:hypothetical protein
MANENEKDQPRPLHLRSKFCDGNDRHIASPAQLAADQECKQPRQPQAPGRDDPFESHGLN